MAGIDSMPAGRSHRKADPKRARQIREGGKKADQIKRKRERQHDVQEVPEAERELQSALAQFYDEH